jgi:hypothetical protein
MAVDDEYRVQALREAVLGGPGVTSAALRTRIAARTGRIGTGLDDAAGEEPPPEIGRYVDAMRDGADRVARADVEALRSAGHDDAAVFEITVAAAVGVGLARLELVRRLLRDAGAP